MRFALFSSVSFLFLAALPVTAQAAFEFVPPPQQTAPAMAATAPEVPAINNEPVRSENLAPAPVLTPIAAPTPPVSMAAPEAPKDPGAPMELGRKAIPLTPIIKESDALRLDDSLPAAPALDRMPVMAAEPVKPSAPSFGSENVVEAPRRVPPRNASVSTEDLLWDNDDAHTGRRGKAAATSYGSADLPTALPPMKETEASVDAFSAPLPPLMPPKSGANKTSSLRAPHDVIESDIPSVPAAPAMPSSSAYASELDEGAPVQGFGRQVPLAMALQQIVPPSYRYSFDQGVDPGLRVSWTGGKPWKAIITDLARQNGLSVDIVTNVVAFHRNSPMDIVSADTVVDTSADMVQGMKLKPLAGLHDPATDPMLLPPLETQQPAPVAAVVEPASVAAPAPVVAQKNNVRPHDRAKFDALLDSDLAAGARVKDKRILVAENEKMIEGPDDLPSRQKKSPKKILMASTSETKKADEASPMNIVPPSSGQEAKTDMPSVANPPVKDEWMKPLSTDGIAMAPEMSAHAMVPADLTSVVEWEGYKNQTMRETLMSWSQRAGVSVVWSSEYDYPLQTDVRVQANYGDAVRTLLAGFSKAQPRPIGRLFKNDKVGAQPVLVVETQRLTN